MLNGGAWGWLAGLVLWAPVSVLAQQPQPVPPVAAGDAPQGPPSPDPGVVEEHGGSILFRWAPVQGARRYHVQVGKTLLFIPPAADERTAAPFLELPRAALENRLYYWRVSSVDADGVEGPPSAANLLNLQPQRVAPLVPPPPRGGRARLKFNPERPTQDEAIPGRTGAPVVVRFSWRGKAWRARVQVARDAAFTDVVADQVVLKGASNVKLPHGAWHYRLSQFANKKGADALWSRPVAFRVEPDDTPPLLAVATPASQVFTVDRTVTIQGATEADATLTLAGRRVTLNQRGEFIHEAPLKEGRNELVLEARDAAGNPRRHTVVAVRLPARLKENLEPRLQRLQRSLDELAALSEHESQAAEELSLQLLRADALTPEMADDMVRAQRDLAETQKLKKQIDDELAAATRTFEEMLGRVSRTR